VSAGGVVRDPEVHRQVIARVVGALEAAGFDCQGWRESPIKGASSGNTEFLAYLRRRPAAAAAPVAAVAAAEGGDQPL
jgi:23S rRNA (cytidine1920-2'-O)/16S rRNA (cytidine1409-2'-O)-methyltransferase